MNNKLNRAINLLNENQYTCVVINDKDVYWSKDRGVKPLINLLQEKKDLTGFVAADKVVGKGAAMLYQLLNIKEVYAVVISKVAYEYMKKHHIDIKYDTLVERIVNRNNTGFCPIEEAVMNIEDANLGLQAIINRLDELRNN